jgi:hypothetical protein
LSFLLGYVSFPLVPKTIFNILLVYWINAFSLPAREELKQASNFVIGYIIMLRMTLGQIEGCEDISPMSITDFAFLKAIVAYGIERGDAVTKILSSELSLKTDVKNASRCVGN